MVLAILMLTSFSNSGETECFHTKPPPHGLSSASAPAYSQAFCNGMGIRVPCFLIAELHCFSEHPEPLAL